MRRSVTGRVTAMGFDIKARANKRRQDPYRIHRCLLTAEEV
jgi:hypothetical protein